MLELLKESDFWLSLITALTAIIALFQSHRQIKISNKQALFERRVEKYILIEELLLLFEHNRSKLDYNETFYDNIKTIFVSLTNATLLKRMRIDFFNPLENNDSDDFFEVSEKLNSLSVEVSLIWKGKSIAVISRFISDYKSLLGALHMQNAYMISEIESPTLSEDTLLNKAKQMAEHIHLRDKVENAKKSYDEIISKKAFLKLKNQIKL